MFGTLGHDAAVAWRGLIRKPFYPIATIIMLALAIGANETAFGIFYGYDLKPLPYAHPSRLVMVRQMSPRTGLNFPMTAPATYRKLRAALPSIADAGLWTYGGSVPARIDGKPRAVHAVSVTPSFFSTLGVRPALGRLPSPASGHKGGPKQAMISYRFWQSAYGGNAGAVGQEISFDGGHYRIVGVLPRSFGFMTPADLWASFVLPRTGEQARNVNDFMPVELAPGVSLGQFNAALHRVLHQEEAQATPERAARMRAEQERLDARPIRQVILANSDIGDIPVLLQGAALFLLLLAVVNAGNLALVRHRSRLHELHRAERVLDAPRRRRERRFRSLAEHLLQQACGGLPQRHGGDQADRERRERPRETEYRPAGCDIERRRVEHRPVARQGSQHQPAEQRPADADREQDRQLLQQKQPQQIEP